MNALFGKMVQDRALRSIVVLLLLALAGLPLAGVTHAQAAPALDVVSPADGAALPAHDLQAQLTVSDLKRACAAGGRPDPAGVGQIRARIDGASFAQRANV